MNFTGESKVRLQARNEGKLKSYQSCSDVRAWSHDVGARDRYLREWIKSDMSFCVIPIRTLTSLLKNMTYKSRGKVTPRCHPNCKSRAVLESICASCHAMKECLKSNENFQYYFNEEEFETTHWPCDRCLEALKSIKMLWKIIIEKIFHIKLTKNEKTEEMFCNRVENVPIVAKVWQNDMIQEAMLVNSIITLSNKCPWKCPQRERTCRTRGSEYSYITHQSTSSISTITSQSTKKTPSYIITKDVNKSNNNLKRKVNRSTSFRVKFTDVGCDPCNTKNFDDELHAYKKNVEKLQDDLLVQSNELDILKKENALLKLDLQNFYGFHPRNLSFNTPANLKNDNDAVVPRPFETCDENILNSNVQDIDSEMIITMKDCESVNYKHVSVLQVVHKTNDPIIMEKNDNGPCCKKENPIELLNKVQNTFGAIVRREVSIVNGRRWCSRKSNIDATYCRVNISRSAPSCCTLSSISSSTT